MNKRYWKDMLPSCFSIADLIFSGHEADEARARTMFKTAIDEDVSMDEIVTEAESFMRDKGARPEHIECQIQKVRNLGHN